MWGSLGPTAITLSLVCVRTVKVLYLFWVFLEVVILESLHYNLFRYSFAVFLHYPCFQLCCCLLKISKTASGFLLGPGTTFCTQPTVGTPSIYSNNFVYVCSLYCCVPHRLCAAPVVCRTGCVPYRLCALRSVACEE